MTTENADLIAEARSFRSGCTDGSYLELRLADEIERLNAKLQDIRAAYERGFEHGRNGVPVADA